MNIAIAFVFESHCQMFVLIAKCQVENGRHMIINDLVFSCGNIVVMYYSNIV